MQCVHRIQFRPSSNLPQLETWIPKTHYDMLTTILHIFNFNTFTSKKSKIFEGKIKNWENLTDSYFPKNTHCPSIKIWNISEESREAQVTYICRGLGKGPGRLGPGLGSLFGLRIWKSEFRAGFRKGRFEFDIRAGFRVQN